MHAIAHTNGHTGASHQKNGCERENGSDAVAVPKYGHEKYYEKQYADRQEKNRPCGPEQQLEEAQALLLDLGCDQLEAIPQELDQR